MPNINELTRFDTRSIFDQSGKLNEQRAQSISSKGDVFLGEYLHIGTVPFAPDPDGSDHCVWLARLVEYIAQLPGDKVWGGIEGGPLAQHDQKVLHAVAMLYCTGRTVPSFTDPNTKDEVVKQQMEKWEERSAEIAERFLREGGGAGTYWSKQEVREDVCRLIIAHRKPQEVANDKRLQVFNDALLFETARYFPNTAEGLKLLRERVKVENFFTGWGKSSDNFRQWMKTRGWN